MSVYVVSGPGVEQRRAPSEGAGLSVAITFASAASRSGMDASFYVRDGDDELVGRADADGAGGVLVYGATLLRRYRERGELPPEIESTERRRPSRPTGADGRPGIPSATSKEEEMAAQTKEKRTSGSSGGSSRKTIDAAREATAVEKKPAATKAAAKSQAAVDPKPITAKQATVSVLKAADGPLAVADIAERVLRKRGVRLSGKTPKATIAAMLSIESNKPDGLFVKAGRGMYALRDAQDESAKA